MGEVPTEDVKWQIVQLRDNSNFVSIFSRAVDEVPCVSNVCSTHQFSSRHGGGVDLCGLSGFDDGTI